MLDRLMLRITKFQLLPSKHLSTVVKNILFLGEGGGGGGHHAPPMSNSVNSAFLSFVLLVSSQFVPSGGLPKGLYARHHCWALDGFKLEGLFYLSLLLRVFYFEGY